MKNIHILPTDKPSGLYFYGERYFTGEFGHGLNRNIHITSDEEIKEGDWIIRGNEQPIKVVKDLAYYRANAEEDYLQVPISVLRYISELEERSYSEEDMKQFAWECVANFLSNSDNKVEMALVEVIMDRNSKQFEQFKKK
jgi:hypothetical protein